MQSFALFTDSTADFSPELAQEMDVKILPLSYTLNGTHCTDAPESRGEVLPQLYRALRSGESCQTHALNISDFERAFLPVLRAEQDILYLSLSGSLSGSYQNSRSAVEILEQHFPERQIVCLDTRNASMGEALMVLYAARMRQRGKQIDEITDWLAAHMKCFCAWFTVEDLNFLGQGGRFTAPSSLTGAFLSYHTVLHLDEKGKPVQAERVRGRRASMDALLHHYELHAANKGHNIVMLAGADRESDLAYMARKLQKLGVGELHLGSIGPVIGAHCGPGTVALFYLGDER